MLAHQSVLFHKYINFLSVNAQMIQHTGRSYGLCMCVYFGFLCISLVSLDHKILQQGAVIKQIRI